MSAEFWGMLAIGVAVVGLNWRMINSLDVKLSSRIDSLQKDMGGIDSRLARIEGWIAGRFREEPV